jgi:hypothetical protein
MIEITINGQMYRRVDGQWLGWKILGGPNSPPFGVGRLLTEEDAQAFGDEIYRLRIALSDIIAAGVVGCEEMQRIAEEAVGGRTKE